MCTNFMPFSALWTELKQKGSSVVELSTEKDFRIIHSEGRFGFLHGKLYLPLFQWFHPTLCAITQDSGRSFNTEVLLQG